MQTSKLALSLVLCLAMASSAQSAVIGDKDWLHMSNTIWYSWNEMDAIFDPDTGRCDVSECIMRSQAWQRSIDMSGYIWASTEEVNTLWTSFTGQEGLDSLTSDNYKEVTNTLRAEELVTLIGPTDGDGSDDLLFSFGTTRSQDPQGQAHLLFIKNNSMREPYRYGTDSIHLDVGGIPKQSWSTSSAGWFYKPVEVTAPPVWIGVALAVALVGFRRRGQNR